QALHRQQPLRRLRDFPGKKFTSRARTRSIQRPHTYLGDVLGRRRTGRHLPPLRRHPLRAGRPRRAGDRHGRCPPLLGARPDLLRRNCPRPGGIHGFRLAAGTSTRQGEKEATMKKIGFVLAVALVAIALPLAAQADPATIQSVDVTGWNDLGPNPTADVHGTASLVRRDNGIWMTFRTSGLPANQPVTVWWIIVDPATGNVVSAQFADGHIVGGNGAASFAGSLKEGDTSGCFHPAFPCAGLTDARGQIVLLLARVHGEKDPGRIP